MNALVNTNSDWLVQKFGGSALREANSLQKIADIVESYTTSQRVAVVTSALFGITDALENTIRVALENNDDLSDLIQTLKSRHIDCISALNLNANYIQNLHNTLDISLDDIQQKLSGIRMLDLCPDTTRAEILVVGELLSSQILTAILQSRGLSAQWCTPDNIRAQEDSARRAPLSSRFDIAHTQARLNDFVEAQTQVLVIPGFVASYRSPEQSDQTVTLGRNGSDYSAAGVAAALQARLCQIWKDVYGIYTADPRIVPNSQLLHEVSYTEAMELSYFGAKVINAKALLPLTLHKIDCEIRNFDKPEHPGTLIHASPQTDQARLVKGVTHLENVSVLTLSGMGLRGMVGFARRVSDALARQDVSILLIVQSSSEYSLTLCVASENAAVAKKALEDEFYFELEQHLVEPIILNQRRSVVSLVGDGMKHQRGVAARFLQAIASARVNVEIIAQGSTESAIALVVKHDSAPLAVKATHAAFFSELLPLDVILLGCGNVGAELLAQIQRQQDLLKEQHIGLRVCAIANSRQLLHAPDGIDLDNWKQQLEQQGEAYDYATVTNLHQRYGLLNPVIVDCSTNATLGRQYASFLRAGFHVIAANKKANTEDQAYYAELRTAAKQSLRKFLYETNVGAGLPVLDTLQSLLRSGDTLFGFQGILSGSLSLIMGLLQDGMSFSEAVLKAKDMGFTEPDPRDDLSGMDVARKLLIIAREVGFDMELADIEVEALTPPSFDELSVDEMLIALPNLNDEMQERISAAKQENKVLRYVGSLHQGKCKVGIEAVDASDPLASVRDGENVLVLNTQYYNPKPLILRGYGAGAEVTAAGVFGDILRTLRGPADR
ncbi:MAG: bifunctional aspartate kinase/homoserine dehydrogenase I [Gammaproteobacteria bacterium]|nr:bifunctional aspartate kinase/homoserine dehydrogenase I [Gammaproteobacteria bacterium]NNC98075.1 bifunctional aspartate kinase/homoserine dehydrogenase I [Gammaproteobacteria bacterium]